MKNTTAEMFKFWEDNTATIRKIINKRLGDIWYFTLSLEGFTESVELSISPEWVSLIQVGTILIPNSDTSKAYTLWKNGCCPVDVIVSSDSF